jgi:hypothetical protein
VAGIYKSMMRQATYLEHSKSTANWSKVEFRAMKDRTSRMASATVAEAAVPKTTCGERERIMKRGLPSGYEMWP